jgi:serine protease AprX
VFSVSETVAVSDQQDQKTCPLCHQPVIPGRYATQSDIEPAAVKHIQAEFPEWEVVQGACVNCVQRVLGELVTEFATDPHAFVETPFYGILPLSLRLGVERNFTGKGTTIAFLDSGFAQHPDLKGRIKLYVDASSDAIRELPQVEESGTLSWHGMMTSVMACGDGTLSDGLYRSLAYEAELVLVRVSDIKGHVRESGIARGLRWVRANAERLGINIVNISLGGDKPRSNRYNPVDSLVDSLVKQGILVVCAAGNAGNRWLVPPASAASALTVGGLDDKNTLDWTLAQLWHSNYGLTRIGVWKPEVVAPSIWLAAPVLPSSDVAKEAQTLQDLLRATLEDLPELLATLQRVPYSKIPADITELTAEEAYQALQEAWQAQKLITPHYQHVDGTSFAAPIVSSVAAQMLQANPSLQPVGLKDLIMRTARYLPKISPDQQGHGVVDPWVAVTAAVATNTTNYIQPLSV